MYINKYEVEFVKGSWLDEIGRVFYWKGRIFRGIYVESNDYVKELFESGLINELIQEKLFPKTWISEYKLEGFGLVLEHELILNMTYPYEWSFNMFKDAALVTLKVNIISMRYGYQTKDAHGHNIVFNASQPVFVDFGSFMKTDPEYQGWIALEEFMRYYYYVLTLWSEGNHFLAKMTLASQIGAMTHESFLLYKWRFLRKINVNYIEKIAKLYYSLRNLSVQSDEKILSKITSGIAAVVIYLKKRKKLPFQKVNLQSIVKDISKISYRSTNTMWKDYHSQSFRDGQDIIYSARFQRIAEIIKTLKIENLCELAGNQGIFSKLLLEQGIIKRIICSDYDENAVDIMYLMTKKDQLNCSSAILNFTNPVVTSLENAPHDRFKSDIVVALAVTHHLILTQKIPIDLIFNTLKKYTRKYICVEFMPLGLYDGEIMPLVPEWYNIEWFRTNFKKYFNVLLEEKLEDNRVVFIGIIKL